jgi:DNA-directed RNA polymerase sigma subunit (sigma70/sigma32)
MARPRSNTFAREINEAVGRYDWVRRLLARAVEQLPPREAGVLFLRFGLGDDRRVWTLEELGDAMAVTRERVRQLEVRGLELLGAALERPRPNGARETESHRSGHGIEGSTE